MTDQPPKDPIVVAACLSKAYGNWHILVASNKRSLGPNYVFAGESAEDTAKAVARAINDAHWKIQDEAEIQKLEKTREGLLKAQAQAKAKEAAEEARIEAEVQRRLAAKTQTAEQSPSDTRATLPDSSGKEDCKPPAEPIHQDTATI